MVQVRVFSQLKRNVGCRGAIKQSQSERRQKGMCVVYIKKPERLKSHVRFPTVISEM